MREDVEFYRRHDPLARITIIRRGVMRTCLSCLVTFIVLLHIPVLSAAEAIKLGLNYPSTGRYKEQGLMQARGALMAIEEINNEGGVLGRPLDLLLANTASKPDKAVRNVKKLAKQGAAMLFGGASSAVAIAAGKEAAKHNLIYFGTLTYANGTTGKEGHRHMFRESYNAWMASKALGKYLNEALKGKKLFYITADYSWGWSTEESLRLFTKTKNTEVHKGVTVRFPRPREGDFAVALDAAMESDADVLMLIQFGDDMARALRLAHRMGLKDKMTIIVPNLTLGMARSAGAGVMEDVIGAVPWSWQVPYQYDYPQGKIFVEAFVDKYQAYPSSAAASAYNIVYQFKDAVERTRSLGTDKLIKALENHRYTGAKDPQYWRDFDHQNIQSVYVVRSKPRSEVMKSHFHEDVFEVLMKLPGEQAARTHEQWLRARNQAGKPPALATLQ
jgi:branched-chain amino acid transport system substrate-binding protein